MRFASRRDPEQSIGSRLRSDAARHFGPFGACQMLALPDLSRSHDYRSLTMPYRKVLGGTLPLLVIDNNAGFPAAMLNRT
ncbi:MAG: hypothetical protein RLZZ621_1844 [Gemmatimonadota bacterium]